MKLVGYIRVSRVNGREGESFISPTLQRESIETYAKVHGHKIVGWQQDLDQPGSKLERPGLDAALASITRGDAEGLIAAKLDRITRSVADLGKLLEQAKTEQWNLIAVDLGLDFATSNGKLVANVLGSVAEWELDRRREGWRDAQANAVERGVHVASRTPTGYRRRADRRLEPDPVVTPIVHELFLRRAAGASWAELADYMTQAGVRTPYGNETWTPSAVATLIRNRVYLGEARSGRHVNEHAHVPIVTRLEWEAAQGARPAPSPRNGDGLLLSGLVRCGGCRYRLKPDTMTDRDGSRIGNYRCRARHAAGRCPAPASALARVLDPFVEGEFLNRLANDRQRAEASVANENVVDALRELEEAEYELAAYLETTVVSIIGREAFERGARTRTDRVDTARKTLAEARQRTALAEAMPETPGDLMEAWPRLSTAEKRTLLAATIDTVILRSTNGRRGASIAERAVILWRGEAPDDLPERGRRVPLVSWEPVASDQ